MKLSADERRSRSWIFAGPTSMTRRPASSNRERRRSRLNVQLPVEFGNRNGSRTGPAARHVVRATLEQFVDGCGDAVAAPERDDFTVEEVRLDAAGTAQHALPRRAPDASNRTDGVVVDQLRSLVGQRRRALHVD